MSIEQEQRIKEILEPPEKKPEKITREEFFETIFQMERFLMGQLNEAQEMGGNAIDQLRQLAGMRDSVLRAEEDGLSITFIKNSEMINFIVSRKERVGFRHERKT
jgi:hypothetical protein